MLTVEEAMEEILQRAVPLAEERRAVTESLGRTLAEDVVSDIDSPPYDKSTVDGYALRVSDVATGQRTFTIAGEITAGDWPEQPVPPGMAVRIMTGAPLPAGVDAVVMVEHTTAAAWSTAPTIELDGRPLRVGQNILRRGQSLRQGATVLRAGRVLRPAEIGLLSEVGRTEVSVVRRPRVALLATGNELVPAASVPTRGQIRNSNGPMLRALAEQSGAEATDLGVARDTADDLRQHLEHGLDHDVLVLSGGVSAGVLDLVPRVLQELGVVQVFHQVQLRPGKPLWFGIRRGPSSVTLVLGLPGNPVSSLVCWELFARPALERLQGRPALGLGSAHARLATAHEQRGDRPTYWPAVVERAAAHSPEELTVHLLDWQGSADLRTLSDANCLVHFPPGSRRYGAGEMVSLRTF
ncbi:MAG: gephyrin-like molybdotransferase Glp [Pirellulales bacterium]